MNFTDREMKIIKNAVGWYANKRIEFATAIANKGYIKHDGSIPTKEEVSEAFTTYNEVADLAKRLLL